ncbi:GIN domain-containing protein [Stakelama saccharophila]|uniref:DUF2807 domain-containing protein n=1 Tax=Stakelama saccharophila TaxID=3075605 RepID=A0ABZ0BA59_9SPHN|nr:DUF2807 domain-containing protein [Stakelama sp. W311]WNO54269.1 DUF2807 domain-containing protein [Stakelama sp. W311]
MARLLLILALLLPAAASARDRTVMLSGFDRVRVEGPFRVTVSTNESPGATVSGDPRAVDAVSVRAQGQTLIIGANANDWGGWPGEREALPVISVRTRILRGASVIGGGMVSVDRAEGHHVELAVTGAGKLQVDALSADDLVGIVAGSGTLQLAGSANRARFTNSGTGRIDADKLIVDDLTVYADGPGSSAFRAERSAEITTTGVGPVSVDGDASCTVRGSGPVHCGR